MDKSSWFWLGVTIFTILLWAFIIFKIATSPDLEKECNAKNGTYLRMEHIYEQKKSVCKYRIIN